MIERANPLVAHELQTLGRTVTGSEALIRLDVSRQQQTATTTLQELREQRQLFSNLSQGLNQRLYVNNWSPERIQDAESRLAAMGQVLPSLNESPSQLLPPPPPPPNEPSSQLLPPPPSESSTGPAEVSTRAPEPGSSIGPPSYKMVRTHTMVTDLWLEWSVGWGGRPSIQSLDDTWGHRWRQGNEAAFYCRRRRIIDEIRRLTQRDGRVLSLTAAAEELEGRRRREGLSLLKLNELLRRPREG